MRSKPCHGLEVQLNIPPPPVSLVLESMKQEVVTQACYMDMSGCPWEPAGGEVEAWVPGAFDVYGEGKNRLPSTLSASVTLEHKLRESIGSFRVEFYGQMLFKG